MCVCVCVLELMWEVCVYVAWHVDGDFVLLLYATEQFSRVLVIVPQSQHKTHSNGHNNY